MYVNSNMTVDEIKMVAEVHGIEFHPYAKAIIAKQEELIQELELEKNNWKDLATH